ncbi:maf-like protein [Fonticula alba]|uniref:Maf-like protein n=1 Tax=Fonticula alba TaxID=691883 RepID=A0A058ZGZ3_FONAL|nr:maf-like protein [Fonticula alba]KCV73236.1 maf-like protein [Fonticula alba]|eukprot:XP_009492937.1 maf-like protein [Fonticula alba]
MSLPPPPKTFTVHQGLGHRAEISTARFAPDTRLVLGSSSRWRRGVIREALGLSEDQAGAYSPEALAGGLMLASISPDFDETAAIGDLQGALAQHGPHHVAHFLARGKADSILPRLADAPCPVILITADQIVSCGPEYRVKPTSADECRRFIGSYRENPISCHNSLILTHLPSGVSVAGADSSSQYFAPFPDTVIEQLVDGGRGEVMSCAGGITVESPLLEPYRTELVGSMESIQGLPLALLQTLLDELHQAVEAAGHSPAC